MRIAVVGSGIGGLSCAWALSARHQVTLYEARPHLGMDAHSVDLDGRNGAVRVDLPMRVLFPDYYPLFVGLYREVGVELERLDYAASFSSLAGELYFKFQNHRLGEMAIPPESLVLRVLRQRGGSLARECGCFGLRGRRAARGQAPSLPLGIGA